MSASARAMLTEHLHQLFPDAYGLQSGSASNELRAETVKQVDLEGMFDAVSRNARAKNLFNNLFDEAVTEVNPSAASRLLFARVERYIQDHGLFGVPLGTTKVEDAMLQLHADHSLNLCHFDSMLERVAEMTGRRCTGEVIIGGLEPAEYWSLMIAGLEPAHDNGQPEELMRTHPHFLVGVLQHGLDNGLTPETPVYQSGTWPQCDRRLKRESFRTGLVHRTCASTVSAFDSLVAERRMRERIRAEQGSAAVVPPVLRRLRVV